MTLPTVSVVVVNFNGRQHLTPCFGSLLKQDYPADLVELILVDNASQDGSLELMAESFPSVKVLTNAGNVGFAPAVNQGAAAASGRYLVLINNDAYADPGYLKALVEAVDANRERGVVCAGAQMLDWYGRQIDFVGGGVNFYGMGNQFFHQLPVGALTVGAHELLFACGGAMLVDRQVFLRLGGFDESFFAYFEDVDFGWRLWVYGYRVLFVPEAIVHHRLHATSSTMHSYQLNTLFERNALITIIKNYEDANLYQVLGPALLLLIKRSLTFTEGAINRSEFDLSRRNGRAAESDDVGVPRLALSYMVALKDIVETFPQIWEKRTVIQSQRARPDSEILPMFMFSMGTSFNTGPYLALQQQLVDAFHVRDMFAGAPAHRVLILSVDPLYENLAGPGIRVVEMARYLAEFCHVVLAAPERAELSIPNVTCVAFGRDDSEAIEHLAFQAEVVILQGFALKRYPFLKTLHRTLVVDLYDPFHLENLQLHSRYPAAEAYQRVEVDRGALNELLQHGDFFLCASERQRDLWLGALGSLGRLSPEGYVRDPAFRDLVAVVPFGIDPTPPQRQGPVIKGIVPGIAEGDTLLLWGGGVWDWLDPLTIIQAMATVRERRPDIKLFFLGQRHPNPVDVPHMPMYDRAVELAQALGLHNQNVFFNDRWVPYAERGSYFLEADIGVSAHQEHIETRFAFRTRLLDYIWAGLPMVVSGGDELADVVVARGLGQVVPIGDSAGFAQAILALAEQPCARQERAAAFAQAQQAFAWPRVLAPLLAFCRRPRFAPDKQRALAATPAAAVAEGALPSLKRRLDELDAVVEEKNKHIAYLEDLIRRLENGRVMRMLRRLNR
jgi:GT2 family glycosyltransferase/glycosyltransferase involved in cell wall biosynthesis